MSGLTWHSVSEVLYSMAPLMAIGITLFLATGCVLVRMTQSPVHRQRLGEMTLISVLSWSVLAFVPLPRLFPELRFFADAGVIQSQTSLADQSPVSPVNVQELNGQEALDESWPLTVDLDAEMANTEVLNLEKLLVENAEQRPPATGRPPLSTVADPVPAISSPAVTSTPRTVPVGEMVVITAPPAASRPSPNFESGILPALYLSGASACLLWLLIGQALLLRIRRQAHQPETWLAELFQEVTSISTKHTAQLIVSAQCTRALSWGIWRPVIVLPQSLCHRNNQGQLRTILLHELGHVAQRDARSNLLTCLALPLLYPHPLFWWLRVQIRLAAELVADDWAAQQAGKETYVEDLVALAKVTAGRGILLPGVMGVLSSPSQFYRRMNMLLTREEPLITRPSAGWRLASIGTWIAVVAIATSIAGIQPVIGQTAPQAATEPVQPSPPIPAVAVEIPVTGQPGGSPDKKSATPPAVPVPVPVDVQTPATPLTEPLPRTTLTLKLDAERDELRTQLKRIEQRLRELEQQEPANYRGKTITLPRVDENGRTFLEVLSTDADGKPEKVISRYYFAPDPTKRPVHTNVATAKKAVTEGPVISEARIENGVPVIHQYVLDAGGEKHEIKTYRDPHAEPQPTVSAPPTATNVPLYVPTREKPRTTGPLSHQPLVGYPITQPGPPALPGVKVPTVTASEGQGNTPQLDLISLATSYADAVGAVESAKAQLAEIEPLAKSAAISTRELSTARITLRNAERKEGLLRRIAQSAIANAKHQIEQLKTLHSRGAASVNSVRDAESRLEILNQILDTQSTSETPAKPVTPPAVGVPKSSF